MIISNNKFSYLFSIANGLFPLILISSLTYQYGAEFLGKYFYTLSFISMSQVFIDYGFNLTGIRTTSQAYKKFGGGKTFWDNVSGIIAAKLILVCLILFFLVVFFALGLVDTYIVICFIVGSSLSIVDISWFYYAINQSIYYTSSMFALRLALLLPIVLLDQSVNSALLYTLLPSMLSSVASFYLVFLYVDDVFKCNALLVRPNPIVQLRDGWGMFVNSFAASFVVASWPVFLSLFLGTAELGVYGVANKIMRGLTSFLSPLPQFLIRSEFAGIKNIKFQVKVLFVVFALSPIVFLMCLPLGLYANFFGAEDNSLKNLVILYAVGYIFVSVSLFCATKMIVDKNEFILKWFILVSWLLSAIVIIYDAVLMPLVFEVILSLLSLVYIMIWSKIEKNSTRVLR